MPISVSCPACQRSLALPDDLAGQRVACPYCAAAVSVPESGSLSPSGWQPSPSPVATGDVNPFQSPVSGEARAEAHVTPRGPIRPSPLDLGDALAIAWEGYKRHWKLLVPAFFISWILQILPAVPNVIATIQYGEGSPEAILTNIVVQLVSFLTSSWLGVGLMRMTLLAARGEAVEFADLFASAALFVRAVLANLLYTLMIGTAVLAAVLPAVVLGRFANDPVLGTVLVVTWSLVVVAVAIALTLLYGLYFVAVADGAPGVLEAFRVSARITRGNRLMLVVTFILAGMIGAVGVVACYFGILFTAPLGMLLIASAYLLMSGQIERVR